MQRISSLAVTRRHTDRKLCMVLYNLYRNFGGLGSTRLGTNKANYAMPLRIRSSSDVLIAAIWVMIGTALMYIYRAEWCDMVYL